jgi:hypothetical protein
MLRICAMKGEMSLLYLSTRMHLWRPVNALFQHTYEGVGENQIQNTVFIRTNPSTQIFIDGIPLHRPKVTAGVCIQEFDVHKTNHSSTGGSSIRHGLDRSLPNVSGRGYARTRCVSLFSFYAASYILVVQYL